MIANNLDKICCEDISLIENYESAVSDKTEMWDCHHRLETHDENGNVRTKGSDLTVDELIARNIYYNRPAKELIFLPKREHLRLHQSLRIMSEETKKKLSIINTGKIVPDYVKEKLSITSTDRHHSEETKQLLSKQLTGKGNGMYGKDPWNKGKENPYSMDTLQKMSNSHKGFVTREETKVKLSETFSKMKWWTNGDINKRSTECPGDGWYLGRSGDFKNKISTTKKSQHIITEGSKGLHWYNNGIVEISSKTCPKGFVSGRLKKN